MSSLVDAATLNALIATALAFLVGGIALLARRPALLHCLWVVVLLKLLTPPLIPVSIPWPNVAAAPLTATPSVETTPQPATTTLQEEPTTVAAAPDPEPIEWIVELEPSLPSQAAPVAAAKADAVLSVKELLIALWVLGSTLWLVRTGFHIVQFSRLLKHGRAAPGPLQRRVNELAAQLGVQRPPTMILVPGAVSPMIWAIGTAPRLVFPQRLMDRLDAEQQTTLVLHELAHVLRRDHWVRVLELIVTALFWWHPVVWWAKREIHEAEEQCCDAWVVWAMAGAGRSYALALVQTVEFCSQVRAALPMAASGIGPVPHLRRRLTMIMQGTTPRSLSWIGACAVLGLGIALPLGPVQAQSKPEKADEEVVLQDSRDQQIEVLKRAIRLLEEHKDGDKPAPPPRSKANPEEIEKARAEVKRSEKQLETKRREMEEAARRHHEAMAKLARLEGRPVPPDATRRVEGRDLKLGEGHGTRVIELATPDGKKGEERRFIRITPDGQQGGDPQRIRVHTEALPGGMKGEERRTIRVLPDAPQGGEQRIRIHADGPPAHQGPGDVERRLERLLREIEEIRREIRRQPSRSENRHEIPPVQPPGGALPRFAPNPGARADNLPPPVSPPHGAVPVDVPAPPSDNRAVPPPPVAVPAPPVTPTQPVPPLPATPPLPPPEEGPDDPPVENPPKKP